MSTTTAVRPSGGGLRGAVASEWTKLWTIRSTWWCLASSVLFAALVGIQLGISADYDRTNPEPGVGQDPVRLGDLAVSAIGLVQLVVLALPMLVITGEYATGAIRSTFQWTPVRRTVLLAKTAVVVPVLFVTGCVLALVAAGTSWPAIAPWSGFSAGELLRDVLATGVYVASAAVFTLGVGAVLRSSVGTLVANIMLLMILPMMLTQSSWEPARYAGALLPGGAGQTFLTGSAGEVPIGPWPSLAVLLTWTAATLYTGIRTLNSRDA